MYQTLFCLEILLIFLVYAVAVYTVDTTKTSDTSDSIENSDPIDTNTYCVGSEWVAYKDEKCFKLIRKWATHKEAEDICKEERLQTDLYTPRLVSIKSATEQEYLTNFVFNTSAVKVNVWIGARRLPENGNEFVRNDGSVIDFSNWVEASPTEETGRDCVEMQSRFTRKFSNISDSNLRGINGKWRDVTCESPNYVICQKLQAWSFPKLQQAFLDARKEMKDSLSNLQQNPVPIGFIYAQLPGQPEPTNLWPAVQWGDVSSEYAGLFFRVLGGASADFEEQQNENAPRIVEAMHVVVPGGWNDNIHFQDGEWSPYFFIGSYLGSYHTGQKFRVSDGEVRPRNKAVRIWKRTN